MYYSIALYLHSWNRWIVLVLGISVLLTAIRAMSRKGEYSRFQRNLSAFFMGSLHLQLLLGLLLYFVLSPAIALAFTDFGAAMKDASLRFWAVEHSLVNIIAVALAQTGSILVRRSSDDRSRHRRTLIWTGIALLLILSMIPMGMMGVERPWFRG